MQQWSRSQLRAFGVTKARSVPVIRSAQRRVRGGVSDIANSVRPDPAGYRHPEFAAVNRRDHYFRYVLGVDGRRRVYIHFGQDAPADSSSPPQQDDGDGNAVIAHLCADASHPDDGVFAVAPVGR